MGLLLRGPGEPRSSDSDGEATRDDLGGFQENRIRARCYCPEAHKTSGNLTGHKKKGGKEGKRKCYVCAHLASCLLQVCIVYRYTCLHLLKAEL